MTQRGQPFAACRRQIAALTRGNVSARDRQQHQGGARGGVSKSRRATDSLCAECIEGGVMCLIKAAALTSKVL